MASRASGADKAAAFAEDHRHDVQHLLEALNGNWGLAETYVQGNAALRLDFWIRPNTIEGFFGNLKTGMRGTYKKVSRKWLQSYLDEYAWRYNERLRGERSMFHDLLDRAVQR